MERTQGASDLEFETLGLKVWRLLGEIFSERPCWFIGALQGLIIHAYTDYVCIGVCKEYEWVIYGS